MQSELPIPMATRSAPVFIVGANRSGTTLLRLMLGAHPAIAIPDELMYFRPLMAGVDPSEWRLEPSKDAYRVFVREWLDREGQSLVGFSVADVEALAERILNDPVRDLRQPYTTALTIWAESQGASRWGEKTPLNLFYADVLIDMFPEAQFIHVIRDPRSGVQSMLKMGGFGHGPVWCALNRRRYVIEGEAHLIRSVPRKQRVTVRYEDLVTAPEREMSRLLEFLDEPFDPAVLSFHRGAEALMTDEAASGFNALATRPIAATRAEAWRCELSPGTQARIDAVSGEVLDAYGYPRSGYQLGLRDWIEVVAKWAYWSLQVRRNRRVRGYIVCYTPFARLRGWARRLRLTPSAYQAR